MTKGKNQKSFFTLPEFEQWREENNGGKGWSPKYYKVCRVWLALSADSR